MPAETHLTVERHLTPDDLSRALARDVVAGLTSAPKTLPSAWFYNERGSLLFDEITRLPEYYPTRAERALLAQAAPALAAEPATLIELGSGTCEKTRVLLDALHARDHLEGIVALDISAEMLERTTVELGEEYDGIRVTGVVADFVEGIAHLPSGPRRLVAFLGGTIGNLDPAERAAFFASLARVLGPSDRFLLGCDLVKDRPRLEAAYNDALGVTAEFNRNILAVVNHELDGDFDLDRFEHVAFFDEEHQWIEMRLRSLVDQQVHLGVLDLTVAFAEGEELRTEISAKFTPERMLAELGAAGLTAIETWGAEEGEFLLVLARPEAGR